MDSQFNMQAGFGAAAQAQSSNVDAQSSPSSSSIPGPAVPHLPPGCRRGRFPVKKRATPAVKRGLYAFCADGDVTQVINLLRSFEYQRPAAPPESPAAAAAAAGAGEGDVDDDLRAPLIAAADGAHVHIVRYLLEFWFRDRIDAALRIDLGLAAARNGSLDILRLALDDDPSQQSCHQGRRGISRAEMTAFGASVLPAAVEHEDMVGYLLSLGIDPNIGLNPPEAQGQERFNYSSTAALHAAAARSTPRVFAMLLGAGARLQVAYPLHAAAGAPATLSSGDDRIPMMTYLVHDLGLDVNASDDGTVSPYAWGTPLHHAVAWAHVDRVRWLLGNGADPTLLDRFHQRPLERISFGLWNQEIEEMIRAADKGHPHGVHYTTNWDKVVAQVHRCLEQEVEKRDPTILDKKSEGGYEEDNNSAEKHGQRLFRGLHLLDCQRGGNGGYPPVDPPVLGKRSDDSCIRPILWTIHSFGVNFKGSVYGNLDQLNGHLRHVGDIVESNFRVAVHTGRRDNSTSTNVYTGKRGELRLEDVEKLMTLMNLFQLVIQQTHGSRTDWLQDNDTVPFAKERF
ncbi:hypothetical protein DL764_010485 [Monosporascus ibericus]|uniref:Uncharacterized protein n=1 Tax=Monosporascus ibericus TaxID=155417 RepID=A0A4Q4SV71_9PEZI|nr:hypothetical protein DL764_010485 [Monosporascus ibericus]